MKNKLPHCNFRIVFQTNCKLINFFTFIDKIPVFLCSGIVYELSVVTAMLSIIAKLSAILKSERVNTLEFLLLLERE